MIPLPFHNLKPMLAVQSKTVAATPHDTVQALLGTHIFDLKYDGVRCMAYVQNGSVKLINRPGTDITHRYPDMVKALAEEFHDRDVVLDGELVCFIDGKPAFDLIQRRDAVSNPIKIADLAEQLPATYVAFDLLYLGDRVADDATPVGVDMRRWPYEGRLGALAGLGLSPTLSVTKQVMATIASDNGDLMWKFVQEHGLEGLIAKRKNAPYRGGRRDPGWVKIKLGFRISAVVVGSDAGDGKRKDSFGALKLSLIRDGEPIEWGEVGTGFTEADLIEHKARLLAGQPYVVEIEIAAIYDTGKPRFPSLKGIRTDVAPIDCTWDQLQNVPVIPTTVKAR